MYWSNDCAPSAGSVTVPNPHLAHATFLPPGAYRPEVHATHGAERSAFSTASPCPGSHTQTSTTELPVPGVLLAAGHARHAGRCVPSAQPAAYVPRGQSAHDTLRTFPAALPKPGSHAQAAAESRGASENSCATQGRHCVCALASE